MSLVGVLVLCIDVGKPWVDFFRSAGWSEVRATEARVDSRTTTSIGRTGQTRHTVYTCRFSYNVDGQAHLAIQSVLDSAQTDRCVAGASAWVNPDDATDAVMARGMSAGMILGLFFAFLVLGFIVVVVAALVVHNRRLDGIVKRAREMPNQVWRWLPEWKEDSVVSQGSTHLGLAVIVTWLPQLMIVSARPPFGMVSCLSPSRRRHQPDRRG